MLCPENELFPTMGAWSERCCCDFVVGHQLRFLTAQDTSRNPETSAGKNMRRGERGLPRLNPQGPLEDGLSRGSAQRFLQSGHQGSGLLPPALASCAHIWAECQSCRAGGAVARVQAPPGRCAPAERPRQGFILKML